MLIVCLHTQLPKKYSNLFLIENKSRWSLMLNLVIDNRQRIRVIRCRVVINGAVYICSEFESKITLGMLWFFFWYPKLWAEYQDRQGPTALVNNKSSTLSWIEKDMTAKQNEWFRALFAKNIYVTVSRVSLLNDLTLWYG